MLDQNFMLSDIISTWIGFILFPLVLIIPGYVTSYLFDIFDFSSRRFSSRFAISLLISISVSPILYYLLISLFSLKIAVVFTFILLMAFVFILWQEKARLSSFYVSKPVMWVVIAWLLLALFSLVDLQQGQDQLYFSVESYDHTTRVSIVDAMTRTGVPPINPSYYPGEHVKLTFLYFFWYILASVIDFICGNLVDARTALFASIVWCGIALMACIAFYLRKRNQKTKNIWKQILIGILLLAVTGLDILPTIALMFVGDGVIGDLEHWNEQITAWVGSLLWAPHHVAGLITGIVAIMLAMSARGKNTRQRFVLFTFAGVAFASLVGLSIWVALVFVLFWGIWLMSILFYKTEREMIFPMLFSGLVAVVLAGAFLAGLLSGSGTEQTGSSLPITLDIRHFSFADVLIEDAPVFTQALVRLIFLPLNYLFELGFFMIVGILWLKFYRSKLNQNNYYKIELILFLISFTLGTFTRSTLITNNDLGWRAWLPGQFILLIWGVDILSKIYFEASFNISVRTKALLLVLALLGISTTLLDMTLLRFAYYFSFGSEAGQRIYSARQTYTFISDTLPEDIVVQYNPSSSVNRPIGLYGMRQTAISDRTAYGIPQEIFLSKVQEVSQIFNLKDPVSWNTIDSLCKTHFIDVLVITNNDNLWSGISGLTEQRTPLYKDNYHAVFTCGIYKFIQP